MNKFTTIAVAAAIAITSATAAAPAQAASFAPAVSKNIETAAPAVEEVGRRARRNAAAAVGIAAFATGLAIAAGAAHAHGRHVRTRDCYMERVRVWSPRRQAYVIRRERVCY